MVTFERLPPERKLAAPEAASAGSCCCCCCCCLHTVGAVVGALTAKAPGAQEVLPTAVIGTEKVEPTYRVTKEYWTTVLILSTLGVPLVIFFEPRAVVSPGAWALFYAMVFPVIQLAASVVVAIRNAFSRRPGQRERLRHLGTITLRMFVGGLMGIVAMILFGALLLR